MFKTVLIKQWRQNANRKGRLARFKNRIRDLSILANQTGVMRAVLGYVLLILVGMPAMCAEGVLAAPGSAEVSSLERSGHWGGHYFPNTELVTQDGETVRFYDDLIKGKVFALNFIYTRCTDSCPLETAALRTLQKALGDHMGRDVVFYTISIDGDRDNPAELKAYAQKFKAGPGWTFLTGRPEEVTELRKAVGLYRNDGKPEAALNEHGISILLANEAAGQWIKRSPYEETKALQRLLIGRLQSKPLLNASNGLQTRERPASSNSEMLFRTHCQSCHSLGEQDGLGPGLANVVAHREREWLRAWLKAPDRMIREGDPIATELYQRYQALPMPNLKLTDAEIESLLTYLAEQSDQEQAANSLKQVPAP